jgi:hypothetical protein
MTRHSRSILTDRPERGPCHCIISGKLSVAELDIEYPPGMAEENADGLSETPRRGGRGARR